MIVYEALINSLYQLHFTNKRISVKKYHPQTESVHADKNYNNYPDGSVHSPVCASVLFEFKNAQDIVDAFQGKKVAHVYGRSSSSTTSSLQNVLTQQHAALGTVTFATGMAAISSFMFAMLKQGDHIIVSQFLFGNTRSFFHHLTQFGISVSFVDINDVAAVTKQVTDKTRIIFAEGLANPLTQIPDFTALGALASQYNIIMMLDTTMTPPSMLNVSNFPIDIVVTSLTKYIAGQGQALGGAVIDMGRFDWTQYPNIDPLYQVTDTTQWGLVQLRKKGLRDIGATLSPEAASAILLGQETLALRWQKIQNNAAQIARFLEAHPAVETVFHPSLEDHAQHQLAQEQFNSFGGILSFTLKEDGDPVAFINHLELIICATHLGDTRTLALPVTQTIFFEFSNSEKTAMGVSESLVRLSVGIEASEDLIADLQQAFTLSE